MYLVLCAPVSEEAMGKGVSQMETGLKKVKDEVKMHDKPQGADRFPQKMKVRVFVSVYVCMCVCVCVVHK